MICLFLRSKMIKTGLDFLNIGSKPHCYSPDGNLYITAKLRCPNCNKPHSRFGVPVLYAPTRAFGEKLRISPEQIEKHYETIQTKTPRVEKSTLVIYKLYIV